MKAKDVKNVKFQILLSLFLILSGAIVISARYSTYHRSAETKDWPNLRGDGKPKEGRSISAKGARTQKLVKGQDHIGSTTKLKSSEDHNTELGSFSSDALSPQLETADGLINSLNDLRYDGYMQIGDMKLAWISDGNRRTLVRKGDMYNDIKIEEIQESFVLVKLQNGCAQEIPFTESSIMRSKVASAEASTLSARDRLEAPSTQPGRLGSPSAKGIYTKNISEGSAGRIPPPLPPDQDGPPQIPEEGW